MTHKLKNKKILYFVADDGFFCVHHLPLALASQAAGAEVSVMTRISHHKKAIQDAGFKLIPLSYLNRSKVNFWSELRIFFQLFSVFLKEKPTIVHNMGMKPILYGSLVACFTGIPRIMNSFTGLGFMFTHETPKALLKRKIFTSLFKVIAKKKNVFSIVQNKDDFKIFQTLNISRPQHLFLIRGCGVDLRLFKSTPEPKEKNEIRVIFVARMLKDKGVLELIEAIRILKDKKIPATFLFCGDIDPQNPSSLSQEDLQNWHKEGLIEWLGYCENIAKLYQGAHIAVLPSYREGLPKSLLEAASCGRPIVTTDVPGCREVVDHDINGLLVPAKDPLSLSQALEKLITNAHLRRAMGRIGRKKVEDHFSLEQVISETLQCY